MDPSQPPNPNGRKSGAWQRSERLDDDGDGVQITTTLTLYEQQWQAILMGVERAGLPASTQEALSALATAHGWETQ